MKPRVLVAVVLAACGTTAPSQPPPPRMFGGDRPVELQVPGILQASRRYPLIVVLHGYGGTGAGQNDYFGTARDAPSDLAFVLAPDGLTDSTGKQFWNADPTCCDVDHKNPDDVGYLGTLIDQVSAAWPIDPKAVVVFGEENGGTMAYRLACDRADVVSNLVVFAGRAPSTPCTPTKPVNVLHIHGTADNEVAYSFAAPSVQQWAVNDHCGSTRTPGRMLDLVDDVPGGETVTESTNGCPEGIAVDLWTIEGGSHSPDLALVFEATVRGWVVSNRRP